MKTKLGVDVQTKKEIVVDDKLRRSGAYIVGASGQGKSLLLAYLIYQDVQKGYAIIVIDPHGDLIRHVISILPAERLKQTYLLDLTDTAYPFGLNLFSCSDPTDEIERAITLDRVMNVFEKHWPETRGILLEKLLRYTTLTFLEHPGYSLADIRRLLWDDDFRANVVKNLTNDEVRGYWEREYNTMSLSERRKELQALDNRLSALRAAPIVKNIVQQKTTIDFQRAIQEHEILLIHLPERLHHAAELIGTILLTQVHAATFAFGELPWNERPGFSLYVDEFQHYSTSDFASFLKEGRKFGARITVAHQDRQGLLPENRSATLIASMIVAFRPTPQDAAELAPLLLDTSDKIRPEHIYAEVIRRLRMHENQEVQDFLRRHVLPLQQKNRNQKRLQAVLDVLQDCIYQSVKTGRINERLFEEYLQRMFPILKLTFTVPQQKRHRLQEQLRFRENHIENLCLYLVSKEALQDYLIAYYSYYSLYAYHHREEWYYQPFVPENILLEDTEFWNYVWRNTKFSIKRLESVMQRIEEQAAANNALQRRNTSEKLIADEERRLIVRWREMFQQIWDDITTIHELQSKYATNEAVRAYHANAYQRCHQTPLERKGNPVFLYPVASKIKNGKISERTRLEDLVIRTLPFEADVYREAAKWLPDSDGHYFYPFGVREEDELQAFSTFERIWQDIIWKYAEIHRIRHLLEDETELLKNYYAEKAQVLAEKHVWERLNNEHIDTNVWDELHKEVSRNMLLSSKMNTAEKLIQLRENELRKKIELLVEEKEAYKVKLLSLEREIEKEFTAIEEQRATFRDYGRRVMQMLIDDPGPLVGKKAVKKEEAERRHQQIRDQTRAKYCQHQEKVEQKFHDEPMGASKSEEEFRAEEQPDFWYEE